MPIRIHPAARERLIEIWNYTERTWGEEQADRYVRGLVDAVDRAREARHSWHPVHDESLAGVFFVRHESHFLFFREFPDGTLGVISILHGMMDVPSRLREDAARDG